MSKPYSFLHRFPLFILLCFTTLSLAAQQKSRLSGKIEFHQPENRLSLRYDPAGLGISPMKVEIPLKEDKFDVMVDIAAPVMATLYYRADSVQLFIIPGKNLEVTFHADAPAVSANFVGDNAMDQVLWQSFLKQYGKDLSKARVGEQIGSLNIDMFELELFTQRKNQQKFIADFVAKNTISAPFTAFIGAVTDYHYQSSLLAYPVVKGEASQEPRISHLPQIMMTDFKGPFSDDPALATEQYQTFLWYAAAYFAYEKAAFVKPQSPGDALSQRVEAAKEKMSGKSLSYTLARLYSGFVPTASPLALKETHDLLAKTPDNQPWLAQLEAVYASKMNEKATAKADEKGKGKEKGQAESRHKFYMMDLDGQPLSLAKYEGKVVYVDFWASWCGPCRGQFPYAKELHEKFTPKQLKDVVFLYISIDRTEQLWKESITKLGLIGEHGFCPGGWDAEVAKYFQITSIPRYMLINKKGEIVNPNAPRPSDESIYDTLLQLMAE